MTTLTTLLKKAAIKLEPVTISPLKEVEDIFCFISKQDKVKLFTENPTLKKERLIEFQKFVEKRATGYPLAYLFGTKGFYGREFNVTKHTLIPRPETELIIDEVKRITKNVDSPSILDVGTGSGNIAITLALEITDALVTASDVDTKALEVAKMNSKTYKTSVTFIESDLLLSINDRFDIIVANIPYVAESNIGHTDMWREERISLKFEPQHALYAGADGLDLYKRFFKEVESNKPKFVLIEMDPNQTENLTKLIIDFISPKAIEVKKDLQGLNRFILISC